MKLSKEVKIAITAIFVLAASIWGYNFLKGKNIFSSSDEYNILFKRVDGLIESGNVMFQGYKIGNITALEFNPENSNNFRVKIIIEENIKIPLNSVVKIKQVNPLSSTSDLEIEFSNETQYHKPGDTLISVAAKGITDYIKEYQSKFDNIISGIDSLVLSVNQVMNSENKDNIQATITSLKVAVGPNGSLMQTLANLRSITANLDNQNQKINTTLDNLSHVTANLDSADIQATIETLNSTLLSLNDIMGKIESGDGSLGKLVNDSSLYSNLDSTTYYLSTLMKDMQDNPKRYVHFSLFGKKEND